MKSISAIDAAQNDNVTYTRSSPEDGYACDVVRERAHHSINHPTDTGIADNLNTLEPTPNALSADVAGERSGGSRPHRYEVPES